MTDKTTGRCASCRWWDRGPQIERLNVRKCQRVIEWWNATKWNENGDLAWTPEAQGVLAFANDGSSYGAALLTLPEFGCVMWQEVP